MSELPVKVFKSAPLVGSVTRAFGSGKRPEGAFRFVFSSGAEDRMGDVIDPSGWDLAEFRRNPIVLWMHGLDGGHLLPIGKVPSLWVEGGMLMGDVVFDAGFNPLTGGPLDDFARAVAAQYASGMLNAVSVGFRPIEARPRTTSQGQKGNHFLKQELLEVSAVPVPANPAALVERGMDGHHDGVDRSFWQIEQSLPRLASGHRG